MDKKIEDYLHLYLGCQCRMFNEMTREWGFFRRLTTTDLNLILNHDREVVLALRPLSDMTEEEANYFAWLCLDSEHHLEDETRVSQDEIDTDLHKNDNATMLDGDIEIYIEVSCRCYEGAVVIRKDGSITLWNTEDEADERIDGMAFKIKYLLSKHFDLFGLIESGLAIDKSTLNQTT